MFAATLPNPILVKDVIVKYKAVIYADLRHSGEKSLLLEDSKIQFLPLTLSKYVSHPNSAFKFLRLKSHFFNIY